MSEKKKNTGTSSYDSLSRKIISKLVVIVAVLFFLIVSASGFISMHSLEEITDDKLVSVAYENAFLIENTIENAYGQALGFANSLKNISALPPEEQRDAIDHALEGVLLGDENFTTVFAYFEQNTIADANGQPYSVHNREIAYEAVAYLDENGTNVTFEKHEDAFDNFDKEYYKTIKSTGEVYVMEPYVYQLRGKDIMMISIIAPVYDAEGDFLGVAGCDVALADMQTQQYASTGYKSTHMIALAEDGTVLLDTANPSLVGKGASEAGYDTVLADTQELKSMPEGAYINSISVINNKVSNYATGKRGIAITVPLRLSSGNYWTLYLAIDRNEFNKILIMDTVKLIVAVILFGIILLYMIYRIIETYLAPVQEILEGASKLEEGNLKINIAVSTNDELGRMAQALNHISSTVDNYVQDISQQLSQMAENDMDIEIRQKYIGDFIPIQTSIEKITDSLNNTLRQIVLSADDVASDSVSVSGGAQALSEGAAEQAEAIEELAVAIENLSRDITANADDAANMSRNASEVSARIENSNQEMNKLIAAMSEIRESSAGIEEIIRTIEDIADQTNLLSLNASIEAARAGEAGRGFAVVANEIRDLAAKSSESVSQTTALIERSLTAVKNGVVIADETAQSLVAVVEGAKEILGSVDKISNASQNQKTVLEEVTRNVDQIEGVVQDNITAAKESALTSEELSKQSQRLHDLVNRFHLKEV
ncbi:MAG: HAMP domain-containing protein [Lachnospiraceae bacterium]|jgi:methyl-accepting chemotaxis protein|nr:HAMP domain-containing protein [Lachnospiraceae bacterium]